jgi:hypothetical protein
MIMGGVKSGMRPYQCFTVKLSSSAGIADAAKLDAVWHNASSVDGQLPYWQRFEHAHS